MSPGAFPAATTPTTTPVSPTGQTTTHHVVTDLLPQWATFPGWELVAAGLIVAAGVYLSKFLVRLLGRPVARRFHRQSVAQTVLRLIRVTTVVVTSLVAASLLGYRLGDFVLSVTVFSAVLGIVLAPVAGSVVNGLFVLADQPYEIGDMIELDDGTRGFVDEITIRYTKVFTLDNTFLVLPNSSIRERDVVNFSAEDERTRLSLELLVTYEGDLTRARTIMERAASDVDGVLEGGPDVRIGSARYPATPTCLIDSYADNGVLLKLRYWAKKPYRLPSVQSEVQTEIWDRIAAADDVEIAYPHQHLVFDETSGSAQVEVERGTGRTWPADEPDSTEDATGGPGPTSSKDAGSR
ncbi:MAG: mechanosensitive ion channel family protein [Haloferacaceae archaeon]